MNAINYRFPKIYNLWLPLVDRNFKEKYQHIAKIVGKNKRVFELGCGTAILADYLEEGCVYIGWDLNERFVNYCQKRGLKVFKKDIFDFADYPENDVIVISDVLHHIVPRDKLLIREAKKRTKRLIITEPIYQYRYQRLPNCLYSIYDKFIGDNDGFNALENRKQWGFNSTEDLCRYLDSLGVQEVKYIGRKKEKFIAVF